MVPVTLTVSLSGRDRSIRVTVPSNTFDTKTLAWSKPSTRAKPQGPSRLAVKLFTNFPFWSMNRSGPAATVAEVPSVVVTLPAMTNTRVQHAKCQGEAERWGSLEEDGRLHVRRRTACRRELDDRRPGPLEITAVIEV